MKLTWVLVSLLFAGTSMSASAIDCSRPAGGLPDSVRIVGQPDTSNPIEHVLVLMQENHSFDNYFGRLNQSQFYGPGVDGVLPTMSNPDAAGLPQWAHHESSLCEEDPDHNWNAIHKGWNHGAMDGFARQSGLITMGYYDETDLPFYYALANQFAIGDRYFCSAPTQTLPNRFFLWTGTAFGHIANDLPATPGDFAQKTIFDVLEAHHISWKYYSDGPGYIGFFGPLHARYPRNSVRIKQLARDLKAGTLPQVAFVEAAINDEDEHPDGNVQLGQSFVAARVHELVNSSSWAKSALFLTYDEGGGFFDHVAPPPACVPDTVAPMLKADSEPGDFSMYGIRVPFVAISPYVKHHFVSHRVYDHTSILRFIENKWNLPALTARDANADGLSDIFDFAHPILQTNLPDGGVDPTRECKRAP